MKVEKVDIHNIHADPANVRRHPDRNQASIRASLARFGQQKPIVVDANGIVRAGNGTLAAALELGWTKIDVIRTPLKGTEATAYSIADNRTSELAEWDETGLAEQLRALQSEDFDLAAVGYDAGEVDALIEGLSRDLVGEDGEAPGVAGANTSLVERFGVPPFSVLDARQGYWQDRKRAWIAAGVGEALGETDGRDEKLLGGSIIDGSWQREKGKRGNCVNSNGTSIFDPVLCELACRWFCPPGGSVLDPFAGGSVRGIVAAKVGLDYTGIDLRPEQVTANEAQAKEITPERLPRWIVGDSTDIRTLAPGAYDLVFSCPPYADLERYSDDPADLSTMDYPAFLKAYRAIVAASVAMLKPDRFACFVVGDIRDKKGFYRNLIADTVAAFHDAGAMLYNEAVLIGVAGSAPLRVDGQFGNYRKLVKTHQNVLVLFKGDPKRILQQFGEVEFVDVALAGGEEI